MKFRESKAFVAWLLIICIALSMVGCGATNTSTTELETADEVTVIDETSADKVSESSDTVSQDISSEPENEVIQSEADPDSYNENVTVEDTSLEDELSEIEAMEDDTLTPTQRNAINMLNYMTVLTQEINDSKKSRIFLDKAYDSLINNTYPNAIDSKSQTQITSMLDTLHQYQMISVKRERLEYIYEQNQAQALRHAIPNPVGLLSVVQSGSLLKAAVSVIYMAVDSVTSYESASSQADLQYLKDGWELDDAEAEEVHKSRKGAFDYMVRMVNDNSLPGDYALNEDAVKNLVEWKNKSNLVSKIAWLEANQNTYKEFGPYWLELAKNYYNSEEYESCLEAFTKYEEVTTRIFRKDTDYAEALPMAIISAKEKMTCAKYVEYADAKTTIILSNTNDSDWPLRYFVAQIDLDLYNITKDSSYLDKAYKIAFDNVNVLVDDQKELNASYLAAVKEEKVEDGATKQQKEDTKQYNKMLKEERKVELPPVSEALYLNCDLLFALAEERGISSKEQKLFNAILHENGDCIFLTEALDERFRFENNGTAFDSGALNIEFDGKELSISASCITDRSTISVVVSGSNEKVTIDDWTVKKVERPKNAGCSEFVVTFVSDSAKKYKYAAGENISINVVPVAESPNEVIKFTYDVVAIKKLLVFDGIAFERK
ncbi:MAG: hypothetical protein SA378_05550 [Sedimentibacter sp.]|uniref:hypothetical protein n=1 Tax=Sedimentibacter sp. TaxID=1960295 RepID=UPI0029825B0F|nr:hypothetical protein [Sedimentibacter sp.]MDW5299587.1 hypothetical protein [Sedimentibacter sp.]